MIFIDFSPLGTLVDPLATPTLLQLSPRGCKTCEWPGFNLQLGWEGENVEGEAVEGELPPLQKY